MIVNIYEEIDDFHRELSETFIGGVGYINHKEKYFNKPLPKKMCGGYVEKQYD